METDNTLYQDTAAAINSLRDRLVKYAIDLQYTRKPGVWEPYKQPGYLKSLRDSAFHFTYLSEAIAHNDLLVFLDYTAWLKVFFAAKHFPADTLVESLLCMKPALKELLTSEQSALAVRFIDRALECTPEMPETSPSYLSPENPYYELAGKYLDLLLNGDRHAASQLILEAVRDGVNVRDIYLHVFQPSQREIGQLWHTGQISVAQEHFCTAVTQLVIAQLYPFIFSSQKIGRTLVAACVGDELHEMGIRMVADFFEMEGWDTYYLGANTPSESIISATNERRADLVAISVTLPAHISKATGLIKDIRAKMPDNCPKVLIGGYPFNLSDALWKAVGADGYAANAQDAIHAANTLLGVSQ